MSAGKLTHRLRLIPLGAKLLIGLSFIFLTYNHWLLAPLGMLLIILLSYFAWPGMNFDRLGLRIPRTHAILALLLLPIITAFAWLTIDYVTRLQGVILIPLWQKPHPFELVIHTIGQTLNEEMILGAVLLTSLVMHFKRLPVRMLSILVAAFFALLHYIFYAWRPETFPAYGILSTITMLSVFAVGVLRNNLILAAGNIAFAWAVHLGWNLIFMDSSYVSTADARLAEPVVFNTVLGSPLILGIIAATAASSIFLLRRSSFTAD